jgi:hypothetical protein
VIRVSNLNTRAREASAIKDGIPYANSPGHRGLCSRVPQKKTNVSGSYLDSLHLRLDRALADARHIRGEIIQAAERRDRERVEAANRQSLPNGKRSSRRSRPQ